GDMASRIALHKGCRVLGVDIVPERLKRSAANGEENIDGREFEVGDAVRALTEGRGADGVVDSVGMEAHGSAAPKLAQDLVGLLPKKLGQAAMRRTGVDRLTAFYTAIDAVRRGGTISLS